MDESQDIYQNSSFVVMAGFLAVVTVALIAINVLTLGGDGFVLTVNSYANTLCSAFAAVLAIQTWRGTSSKDTSKRIWGGIAIGLSLWALGDFISAAYPLLLNQEIPDISSADAVWLSGYLPLALALIWRGRSFMVRPTRPQMAIATGLILVIVATSATFVIWPAIQSADPNDMFASFINLLYPVADVLIAVLSLFILFTLGEGRFSTVWQTIAVGLVLRSFGDLMYSYAAGLDQYWPDNHLTLLSVLVDIPYACSYLAIALGVFMQRLLLTHAVMNPAGFLESDTIQRKVGNTDVLLFTDAKNKVAFVSSNFLKLAKSADKSAFLGLQLKTVLGLSSETQAALMDEINRLGYVRNRPVQVNVPGGEPIPAMLTAATSHSEGRFSGADIVLRVNLVETAPDEEIITLAKQIYLRAGVRHTENLQITKDYAQARIKLLLALIRRMNGENVARMVAGMFNQTALKNKWQFKLENEVISFPAEAEEEQLSAALPTLMRTFTQFAENVAGYQAVEAEIKMLESDLDPNTLHILDSFGVR